jgi:peroxiredoxin Q/BCP
MKKLKEGDKAPAFEGINQDGKTIRLDDLKGKKVILYFYPKDFTSGCTDEACSLRDNYSELADRGFEVIGVSPDNEKSHIKFKSKYGLPYTLISDTEKNILKEYGAWGEKNMYGKIVQGVLRTTFVINEEGVIEKVFTKVNTKDHAQQILEGLGEN